MTVEESFERVADRLAAGDEALERGRIFRSSGLRTRGHFFAFARRGELVVKLPADRVAALVESGEGAPFRSGTRVMREWVVLLPADDDACAGYVGEARRFADS
ncbi:MAG TPA: hypothetical protein VFI37_03830 [Gaiellaceae bacterium]|nr:hypothetical protein [Gaiellaceae bacterium]